MVWAFSFGCHLVEYLDAFYTITYQTFLKKTRWSTYLNEIIDEKQDFIVEIKKNYYIWLNLLMLIFWKSRINSRLV